MSKQTHTNPLSKREVEALRGNPYVASVTTKTVRFTEEFKRLAYEGKQQGITIAETMHRCGIDPEALGASRIEGFSYTLNRKARQDGGFSDGRSGNYRRPANTGEVTQGQTKALALPRFEKQLVDLIERTKDINHPINAAPVGTNINEYNRPSEESVVVSEYRRRRQRIRPDGEDQGQQFHPVEGRDPHQRNAGLPPRDEAPAIGWIPSDRAEAGEIEPDHCGHQQPDGKSLRQ